MLVVIVEPVRVEKLINCEAMVETLSIDTVNVEFTARLFVVIIKPDIVENAIYFTVNVDALIVDCTVIKFARIEEPIAVENDIF